MFYECSSLKELNISNFKINNKTRVNSMFEGCSAQLITEIKNKFKYLKEEAFQ